MTFTMSSYLKCSDYGLCRHEGKGRFAHDFESFCLIMQKYVDRYIL